MRFKYSLLIARNHEPIKLSHPPGADFNSLPVVSVLFSSQDKFISLQTMVSFSLPTPDDITKASQGGKLNRLPKGLDYSYVKPGIA